MKIKNRLLDLRYKLRYKYTNFIVTKVVPRIVIWISKYIYVPTAISHVKPDNGGRPKPYMLAPANEITKLHEYLLSTSSPSQDIYVSRDGNYIHSMLQSYGYLFNIANVNSLLAVLNKVQPDSLSDTIDVLLFAHERGVISKLSAYEVIIALIRYDAMRIRSTVNTTDIDTTVH